jgi:hypothetical protein
VADGGAGAAAQSPRLSPPAGHGHGGGAGHLRGTTAPNPARLPAHRDCTAFAFFNRISSLKTTSEKSCRQFSQTRSFALKRERKRVFSLMSPGDIVRDLLLVIAGAVVGGTFVALMAFALGDEWREKLSNRGKLAKLQRRPKRIILVRHGQSEGNQVMVFALRMLTQPPHRSRSLTAPCAPRTKNCTHLLPTIRYL